MWRIAAGAIATKDALFRRSYAKDPMCPICENERETLEHMLFCCPWVNQCWFGYALGLRFSKWSIDRCEEWLCKMLTGTSEMDEYRKSMLATMC